MGRSGISRNFYTLYQNNDIQGRNYEVEGGEVDGNLYLYFPVTDMSGLFWCVYQSRPFLFL